MATAAAVHRPVAVVGCGTMGAGVAQVAAAAGHPVLLFDARTGAAAAAVVRVRDVLDKLAAKGKLTTTAAAAIRERLIAIDHIEKLAPAAVVIEAIVEELAAKQAVLARLEAITAPQTLLTSNTSSLSITAIAAALRTPSRLVGMHFFNPVPRMELVEIVAGAGSASQALDAAANLAHSWGKRPVRARSTPGFIVNRVARPFYGEALRLLQENAGTVATLDAVLREAGGFPMGPFELMDLIGLDVNYAVTSSVFEGFYGDRRFAPSIMQRELVAAGWLGRKSGRGFYAYGEGAEPSIPATEAAAPPPRAVVEHGNDAGLGAVAARLEAAGVPVERRGGGPARIEFEGVETAVTVALSDGRSAAQHRAEGAPANLVLLDLAFDYARATRIAAATAPDCPPDAWRAAAGMLQAAGFSPTRLRDTPALAVLRTVAMLANEAADAVCHGVASVADVDLAMRLGVNYPRGPLAWADALGIGNVVAVLERLGAHYGEERYRVSPRLRELAWSGGRFHA